ncbi:MAG: hypothetical protein NT102_05260 [Caldiserica bacterium]|nr:hypothetical protein [Caldisericota bacterium]
MLLPGSWVGAKLGSGASDGRGDIIGALFGSVLSYPVGFVASWWRGDCVFLTTCG